VDRLRRSIDDLLSLLRLEQSMGSEARTAVTYRAFLERIADEYRRNPAFAEWRFVVDADDDLGSPVLNERRWAEMLRNLIDNALVQSATIKEIVIAARHTSDSLVTTVRDHGPGISPENQKRIFQRFFTERPPGTTPGTGLGLSIVDSVARAHGGRVEVQSEPGSGAEFRVSLPA
jgi:two-component system OmpR family sensor kinase